MYFKEYLDKSDQAYAKHLYTTYAYGESLAETIDIFLPPEPTPPLQVYIHGGYWQMLSKQESAFNAPFYLDQGTAFGVMGYGLAPDVTLDEIVQQTRWLIWFLYKHADILGFDKDRIHLSGHSAGAQLAFMALFTDWEKDYGIPNDVIKSVTGYSGLYELEPLLHCEENDFLKMDAEAAKRNSPLHQIVKRKCDLKFYYGENETSEFKRQTYQFAVKLNNYGMESTVKEVEGKNHFDLVLLE
ncbi:MAG: alpha/beta hydrolase [Gammaproteobacteria bacterium]|nr:alpha/beta hydrolase [Gammaproteobacteria bacterium]